MGTARLPQHGYRRRGNAAPSGPRRPGGVGLSAPGSGALSRLDTCPAMRSAALAPGTQSTIFSSFGPSWHGGLEFFDSVAQDK